MSTTVRKLSPSNLKKLLAPFSPSTYTYKSPVSHPLHSPSPIFSISQNPTKTLLFVKPFSSQPGLANKARVNQRLSINVESDRVDELQSHADLASEDQMISWENPEEGFIKVNAAVFFRWAPLKLVVIAGVFRDSLGHFRGAFSQRIRNASCSSSAEYQAVAMCVERAAAKGHPNVIIETVNKEVCDTITKYMRTAKAAPQLTYGPGPDHAEKKIKKEKRECLKRIAAVGGTYRFAHAYKEANGLADFFATRGTAEGEGLKVFESLSDTGVFEWVARGLWCWDYLGMKIGRGKMKKKSDWKWWRDEMIPRRK